MGRGSGGTRALTSKMEVKSPLTLYQRAKKAREEALAIAETFKGKPKRFAVDNGIKMDMEMSRQDIKTLVGKNTPDDEFNLLKNEAAKDIPGFMKKAKYEGWSEVQPDKHPESAYFVYYSQELRKKIVLCVRKMKDTGRFKPYSFYTPRELSEKKIKIKKGTPL